MILQPAYLSLVNCKSRLCTPLAPDSFQNPQKSYPTEASHLPQDTPAEPLDIFTESSPLEPLASVQNSSLSVTLRNSPALWPPNILLKLLGSQCPVQGGQGTKRHYRSLPSSRPQGWRSGLAHPYQQQTSHGNWCLLPSPEDSRVRPPKVLPRRSSPLGIAHVMLGSDKLTDLAWIPTKRNLII